MSRPIADPNQAQPDWPCIARTSQRLVIQLTVLAIGFATLLSCGETTAPPDDNEPWNVVLEILTHGDTIDFDGYTVRLDAGVEQRVEANDTVTFRALDAGAHTLTLGDIAVNCTADGDNPRTIGTGTSSVTFTVNCEAALFNHIAFESDRDGVFAIYTMPSDGSDVSRMTDNPVVEAHGADWSPDGTKIVFYDNRDGDWEIFVMAVDGTNVTQLTQNTNAEFSPVWSPNGERIALPSV